MKVALVTRVIWGLHGYGGMERHVLELARFLVRFGVEVTVVTMPPSRRYEWNEPGVNVQVLATSRLPLRGIPDRVTNYPYWSYIAGQYLAEQNFDLVHAQGLAGWGYARMLAQGRAHAPLVINPQGMEEFKTSFAKRLAYAPFHYFVRQAAKQATALIAADSNAAHEIPRFLHVPPEKVVLIPNGIDVDSALSYVHPETLRTLALRWQLQQRTPLLLSVGRLEPNKGFDVLIRALAPIRPALPSKWLWLIVGEGPQRGYLEGLLRRYKLGPHAQFVGNLDDLTLHNLYELATLFVHPTLFEGSSLVTLEAMAHSRPIVATTVGGIPDKVQRGYNGYLVPPGNPTELGAKLIQALREGRRLEEMGAASHVLVRRTFDWPQVIRLTLSLYEHVTGKPLPHSQLIRLDSDAPIMS